MYNGNINELRNVYGNPRKSSLFFLTILLVAILIINDLGINSIGEKVKRLVK